MEAPFWILVILWLSAVAMANPFLRPIPSSGQSEEATAMDYLRRYGHVGGIFRSEEESFRVALTRYQRYHGLDQTGRLDEATKFKMAEPRCGLPDNGLLPGNPYSERFSDPRFLTIRNYSTNPTLVWGERSLPYMVHSGHSRLSKRAMYYITGLALQHWCIHTQLSFIPVFEAKASQIEVRFGKGYHVWEGIPCPVNVEFDGPGGILAHAIWPFQHQVGRGDVHVDEDEPWDVDQEGTHRNLVQVLTHEIGHSMGILHSDDNTAIMYPHYKPGSLPHLMPDDIRAIQGLYGAPNGSESVQRRCSMGLNRTVLHNTDAAMRGLLGEIYVFKGNTVYDLYEEVEHDYIAFPLAGNIADHFPSAPSHIDAAESFGNHTYLIKNYTVYKYHISDSFLYVLDAVTTMKDEFDYYHSLPQPTSVTRKDIGDQQRLEFISGSFRKVYPPDSVQKYNLWNFFGNDNNIVAAFPGSVYDNNGKLHQSSYTIYPTYYRRPGVSSPIPIRKALNWAIYN